MLCSQGLCVLRSWEEIQDPNQLSCLLVLCRVSQLMCKKKNKKITAKHQLTY